jgi:hypothetical protein
LDDERAGVPRISPVIVSTHDNWLILKGNLSSLNTDTVEDAVKILSF